HVEVIMAVIWFISLFFKVAICFFVSAQGMSQLIKVQDYRIVTFPIGIFLFVLSFICIPSSMYLIHFINSTWLSYSVTYGLFFPLFLLAVELIRKRRKSHRVNGR
ncbi:GerAB/ArcD/ProY family transporter, partial [Priestia megaterium]